MSQTISFEGIGAVVATFAAEDDVTNGALVTMASSNTVEDCDAGDDFCGVAMTPVEGFCAVQIAGLATVSYSSTAPTVGYASLVADGSGGVKVDATNGRAYLVIAVDTTNATVTVRL